MPEGLRSADLRLLAALWQELADAPAAQADAALRHGLERLCAHIGARNAFWVGARRESAPVSPQDPYRGWRIRGLEYLHDGSRLLALGQQVVERLEQGEVDPSAVVSARLAGRTRSMLRCEMMDEPTRRTDWVINEVLAGERIGDRLEGAHSLSGECESHFILERGVGERPFSERERDLLLLFLEGSRSFQRELLMAKGIAEVSAVLSPREQEVLRELLTDAGEKEIAARLGIGHRTVHQHALNIYAKFGVRGRQGLMAKWLRARGE